LTWRATSTRAPAGPAWRRRERATSAACCTCYFSRSIQRQPPERSHRRKREREKTNISPFLPFSCVILGVAVA